MIKMSIVVSFSVAMVCGFVSAVQAAGENPVPFGWATNGAVAAIARGADGATYIGGGFTSVGLATGAAMITSPTGSGAPDVVRFPRVDGVVKAVTPDGRGGWFIGGSFNGVGGVARNHIARILPDGSVDLDWNPDVGGGDSSASVMAIAVSGSNVIFGGKFERVNGVTHRYGIARTPISGTGIVDAWNPSGLSSAVVNAIAPGTDGSVFVGGEFSSMGGQSRPRIAKLLPSGLADASWNPNPNSSVFTIALSGSDVFFGGAFTAVGGTSRNRIAKTPAAGTGAVDASWNPNASGFVRAIVYWQGQIFFGGDFATVNGGTGRLHLAKTPSAGNGTIDGSWTPAVGAVRALAVWSGELFFGGALAVGAANSGKVALSGTGTIDPTWSPNVDAAVLAIGVGTRVVLGGEFKSRGGVARNRIARLNADESLDLSWNPDVNGWVSAITVSGGDVYFGGAFTSVNGDTTRRHIAKTSATGNGSVDPTWNPDVSHEVRAIAVAGTSVFFGGQFVTVNGDTPHRYIAKSPTTGNGAVDTSWNPDINGAVRAIAVSGTSVLFGGDFTTVNGGATIRRLAKAPVEGAGTVDVTWNPDPSNTVTALALSATDLFFAGYFSQVNGVTPRGLVAKTPITGVGIVDPNWNPNTHQQVEAIALVGDYLYLGGGFSTVSSVTAPYLARVNASGRGELDSTWIPAPASDVLALAADASGVYVGGVFRAVHGVAANGYAHLAPPIWSPSPTALDFAVRGVGTTALRKVTITNRGGDNLTGTAVSLLGDVEAFALLTDSCTDVELRPGASCDVSVSFSPNSVGAKSATLSFADVAVGSPRAVTLTGSAVSSFELSVEPAGTNCPNGGQRVDVAVDGVVNSAFVCDGADGARAIIVVTEEGAGLNCINGGKRIESSVGSGAVTTSYVCDGADGTNGTNGANGVSAIAVAEPAGANCLNGGIKVTSGGETQYVCNGAAGTTGTNGESVTVTTEVAGPNCAEGGVRLVAASGTSYVCNGRSASIVVTDESAGANCTNGGKRIATSVGGGAIATSYVCNGTSGTSGADGASASIVVTTEPTGVNCINGGKRLDTSIGTGTVTTSYVCNGVNGSDGISAIAVAEPAGANCTHGGIKVTSAGALQYVCNGAPGSDSSDGANGADGQSVAVFAEGPGSNCAGGGVKLVSVSGTTFVCNGVSANVLVTNEAAGPNCAHGGKRVDTSVGSGTVTTSYVCNGSSGAAGANASIAVSVEPAGPNCLAGGQVIETSVGSGATVTSYVCNGEPGANGTNGTNGVSAVAVAEPPGANCPAGGLKVTSGGAPQYLCLDATAGGVTVLAEPPGENCAAGGARIDSSEGSVYVCRGESAVVRVTVEAASERCEVGGQRIETGLDRDSDGVLDDEEVVATAYICHGAAGAAGHDALAVSSPEAVGGNCDNGGLRIELGTDVDDDGVLDATEVTRVSYICNGSDGDSREALIATSVEPPGASCAAGGVRIDGGIDDNDDGVLDATEVTSTAFVCHGVGEPGHDILVEFVAEGAGDNCANGGQRIRSGRDLDDDGALSDDEIGTVAYVCNGAQGEDGADGKDGEAGAGCATGGSSFVGLGGVLMLFIRRRATASR